MKKFTGRAFTLIELMIVVAIIAFLAMMAFPNYLKLVAKIKRSEAQGMLSSLYAAEKAYWVENNAYTNDLAALGWNPEGKTHYTYGFGGSEGTNYIKGSLEADVGELGQAKADKNSFVAVAVADIDGDGKSDVLTIDDKKELKVVQDDLK